MSKKDTDAMDHAGLSAEERAAIEDEDTDIEELEALLQDEGVSDEQDKIEETDDGVETVDDQITQEDVEEVEEEVAKFEPVSEDPVSVQSTAEPDNYDATMAALKQKVDDGVIEWTDYLDQREELMQARIVANVTAEISRQTAERNWLTENNRFFAQNPDYSSAGSPLRFAAMQAAINIVAQSGSNLSDAGMLAKAKELVDADMGATARTETPKIAEKPRLVSSRDKLPPSLKDVPTAAANNPGSGEFANIEKLDGMALEAAIAKMTPDQQLRWAEG